jgi:hypothetical protein
MTLPVPLLGALLLLLQHDDPHMEHVYFWSALLIVLTPAVVFGGIGVWLWRKYLAERGARNAERGTEGRA